MLDGRDRSAIARVCYGLYDGKEILFFEGSINGRIADKPSGENSFGWDKIFIKEGMQQTRAELDEDIAIETSMRKKPLQDIARHIQALAQ